MIIAAHSNDAKQPWAWVVTGAEAGWWRGQQKNTRWHRVAHCITCSEGLILPEVRGTFSGIIPHAAQTAALLLLALSFAESVVLLLIINQLINQKAIDCMEI